MKKYIFFLFISRHKRNMHLGMNTFFVSSIFFLETVYPVCAFCIRKNMGTKYEQWLYHRKKTLHKTFQYDTVVASISGSRQT